jgi:2-oxoglutarate ferredoxin oxidoreductase subunit delta
MANVTFNEDLCKGCGLCISACPKKIIKLSESINSKGYNVATVQEMSSCIGCAFCATICPDVVIKVEK